MVKPHKLADGRYECQNCLRKFTKNEKATIEPKFCKDGCRKEFHTSGGMSLRKLRDLIETEVDKRFAVRSTEWHDWIADRIDKSSAATMAMLRPAALRKRKQSNEASRSVL